MHEKKCGANARLKADSKHPSLTAEASSHSLLIRPSAKEVKIFDWSCYTKQ
jgi:hypothetical protein